VHGRRRDRPRHTGFRHQFCTWAAARRSSGFIDRYYIKTDNASGIVNDPNDWSREVGDRRYVLDLLARVVTVSLETMEIVNELPPRESSSSKVAA